MKYPLTYKGCVKIKAKQLQFLKGNDLFNLNGTPYILFLYFISTADDTFNCVSSTSIRYYG